MIQKNIRPYAGQTYSIAEGSELITELDHRTKHADPKLNSIQLLAEAITGLRGFTTQVISIGGNYTALEVTADLLVFTNNNAQAILHGVYGRREFHILNLSSQYEVRIPHDSVSVSGLGQPIMLPTQTGVMGVKGTARMLYTEGYGYFISDTWGSLYRPEYKGLLKTVLMTVNEESRAGSIEMTEYEVFRDAQSTEMTDLELNIAYPDSKRPFNVVCPLIGIVYKKINDTTGEWMPLGMRSQLINTVGIVESGDLIIETIATIPAGTLNIPAGSFVEKSLTALSLPDSLITIGQNAFFGNSLRQVTFGPALESIAEGAFLDNKIAEVNVPADCIVHPDAFEGNVIINYV